MKQRPDFIKNSEELRTDQSFSYPGDTETFGTGAALGRAFGLKRVAINYEVLAADINKGSAERVTIEKLDQLVQRNLCY
jgi:hypothetical protein